MYKVIRQVMSPHVQSVCVEGESSATQTNHLLGFVYEPTCWNQIVECQDFLSLFLFCVFSSLKFQLKHTQTAQRTTNVPRPLETVRHPKY